MPLRDVQEDDLEIFFEQQREPEANRMARVPARDRDAFVTHWRTNVLGSPGVETKTIVVDGEVAGNVVSWEKDGRRLIGYWLGKAYWGRGVATRAVAEFVADHDKARPLFAHVAVQNGGSMRVLEKCGFARVGDAVTAADGVEELLMRLATPEGPR